MMLEDDPEDDAVWRALGSPMRRRLLDLLRDGPLTTGELATHFPDLSRFAVMQHLGVLEEAKLVVARKQGRQRFNHLNAVPLRTIYERWVGTFADREAERALAVKRFVERKET
ncbi:MAG: helix-turn-helix transcriptional regulator [Actinomycetota bacterium]